MRAAAIVAIVLSSLACAGIVSSSDPKKVPEGDWGGQHVRLSVTAVGAAIEFDCAHVSLDEPLLLDEQGRFQVKGRYTRERGGPVRKGEEDDTRPASYSGSSDGRTLTLSFTPEGADPVGPFELERGRPPRLFKCR
jgi:hypothetical protein